MCLMFHLHKGKGSMPKLQECFNFIVCEICHLANRKHAKVKKMDGNVEDGTHMAKMFQIMFSWEVTGNNYFNIFPVKHC